jgi:hypothetical protein
MAQPSNFLGINTGTDAKRAVTTQPGGISNVLAWITDTARLWFFDGATLGGIELALKDDLVGAGTLTPVFPAQTANFDAVAGKLYHIDTSGGAITATLPAMPNAADTIGLVDTAGSAAAHNITVALNGKNFGPTGSTNPVLSVAYATIKLQFNGTQWVEVP